MQTECVPLQSVESEGEKEALKLANLLLCARADEAGAELNRFAAEKKLTLWEKSAIANIAIAMSTGERWKK